MYIFNKYKKNTLKKKIKLNINIITLLKKKKIKFKKILKKKNIIILKIYTYIEIKNNIIFFNKKKALNTKNNFINTILIIENNILKISVIIL